MSIPRTILYEAFPPAATLLVVLTVAELLESGFTAGVVNMPALAVVVLLLGVWRVVLDRHPSNGVP